MAEFNPKIQQNDLPPGYVSASEGIRGSADTSGATIVEGLTKALESGVVGVDKLIQENIEEDVEAGFDAINAEFGIDDVTALSEDLEKDPLDIRPAGAKGQGTPQGVINAESNIRNLQGAFASGAVNETYYWSRMNSMVKKLRAQYPGYRTEIDSIVSSVTGSRPANELRDALFRDAGKEDPAVKAHREMVEWAAKNGYLPPDFDQRQMGGSPYGPAELRSYIATRTRDKVSLETDRAQLSYAVELGNANKTDITKAARAEFASVVNDAVRNTQLGAGATYKQVMDMIQKFQGDIAKGGNITGEQRVALGQLINQMEFALRTQMQEVARQSWDGKDPEKSYIAQMSSEELNKAMEDAMIPINLVKQAMTAENWGMFGTTSAYLEAQEKANEAELLKQFPVLQTIQAFQNTVGSDVAGLYLMLLGPQANTALIKSIMDYQRARVQLPTAPGQMPPSLAGDFQEGQKMNLPTEYYASSVEAWQETLNAFTDGKLPPDMIQKYVQYVFGPQNFGIFASMDPESKANFFNQVASPKVTMQMLGLRDAGDTQSYNLYKQWVLNSFQALSREAFAELQQYNIDRRQMQIVFNPQTNQFVMVRDPKFKMRDVPTEGDEVFGFKGPVGMAVQGYKEMFEDMNQAEAQMNKLNGMIRTVSPILEADDQNIAQALTSLFQRFVPQGTPMTTIIDERSGAQ